MLLWFLNDSVRRPGDYLQPGEDETDGLKARLDKMLSPGSEVKLEEGVSVFCGSDLGSGTLRVLNDNKRLPLPTD